MLAICNFELLAVESFSEVFCKNHFETTSSLMQFKFAPVSNKTIVSSLNFECALKMSFMMRWNLDGAFFKPKGMTFHSYWPKRTVNAVLYRSLGSI